MHKELCFVLTLTIVCFWAESEPIEFDKLVADISDLKYEVEEEDLDDLGDIADYDDYDSTTAAAKKTTKTSGFKKKNTASKGLKGKHKVEDLKKIYKLVGAHDQGAYDDDDVYALAEGLAGSAVSVTGNEDRKYKKGTKTRGFHRVHHKDEYKKDKEIYEEDETSGSIKKKGAKGYGFLIGGGAGFEKGRFHNDRQKGIYGKRGYLDKGSLDKELNVFANSDGLDESYTSESKK